MKTEPIEFLPVTAFWKQAKSAATNRAFVFGVVVGSSSMLLGMALTAWALIRFHS